MQSLLLSSGLQTVPSFAGYVLGSQTVLTVAGTTTYLPPAGCQLLFVEMVGGGRSGVSANAASAGQISVGSGGGAGAYAASVVAANMSPTGYTVSVGAATALSQFTLKTPSAIVLVQANGAGASANVIATGTTETLVAGGLGGSGGVGDVLRPGGSGGRAHRVSGTIAMSGYGGRSALSGSIAGVITNSVGSNGAAPGAGGSGGLSINGGGSKTGGTGASGGIVIWEFY